MANECRRENRALEILMLYGFGVDYFVASACQTEKCFTMGNNDTNM